MPAELIYSVLQPSQSQEMIVLMDDYGCSNVVQIAVGRLAERASIVAGQQALMESNQANTEAYASAAGHDLSVHKLNGVGEKVAFWNAQYPNRAILLPGGPTAPPGVSTMTVTAPAKA